jgi:type VI secretion system protein ImpK
MSDAGPFDEKTQIVPNPGGRLAGMRRPALAATPAGAPPPPDRAVAPLDLDDAVGLNPLVEAASPILALVSRLSTTIAHPDVRALRRQLEGEFAAFNTRAERSNIPAEIRRSTDYALCVTVDDVIANTPWGGDNVWAGMRMALRHNDVVGGDQFYSFLAHFERDPERHGDVLELFYFCLSLGFQGRFAVLPNGAAQQAEIRARLHRLIRRRRGEVAAELSPHWRGVSAPHRPLASRIPLWSVAACTAALLLFAFIVFRLALATASDALLADMGALPRVRQPALEAVLPPAPPPPPIAPTRSVARFLEPEIREGLVTVQETPQNVVVRLTGAGLFPAGSAVLEMRFQPVVDRIGAAIRDIHGLAMVVGHTDNQPIHTLRFPSNFELSLARAKAVRDQLAQTLGSPDRISVAGRGDAEPIADNASAAGREKNRRVEIIVLRGHPPQ